MFLGIQNNFFVDLNQTFAIDSSHYPTFFEEAFVGKKWAFVRDLLKKEPGLICGCRQGKSYLERAIDAEEYDFVELFLETLLPLPEFKEFLERFDFSPCFEAVFNLSRFSLAAVLLKIEPLFEENQVHSKLDHYFKRALGREDLDFLELLIERINQKGKWLIKDLDLSAVCEKAFVNNRWPLFRLLLANQPHLLYLRAEVGKNYLERAIEGRDLDCIDICLDTLLNFDISRFFFGLDFTSIFELAFQLGNTSLIEKLLKFNPRLGLYKDRLGKNYLRRAIDSCHLDMVECLLKAVSCLRDGNLLEEVDLQSIFIRSYQMKRTPLLRLLLITQPTLLLNTKCYGKTYIQQAVEDNDFAALEIFLGWVSSQPEWYGQVKGLDFKKAFEFAFILGKKGLMVLLLKFEPGLLANTDIFGKNYLTKAVKAKDHASLEIFLGIVLRNSSLHHLLLDLQFSEIFETAFVLQNISLVELLLHIRPGLIQKRDARLVPYLYLASEWGNERLADLSLQAGADLLQPFGHECYTPLHIACKRGHIKIVQLLVHHAPESLKSIDSYGFSPLHSACFFGHLEVVDYLLQCGADPSSNFPACGKNALHLACIGAREEVAELIIERFPNLVDIPTTTGFHPLFLACSAGMLNVAKCLINRGALIDQPNDVQGTALYIAAKYNHPRVVEVLLQYGASILIEASHPEGIHDITCTEAVAQVFAVWQQEKKESIDSMDLDDNTWTLRTLKWLHEEYYLSAVYSFLSEEDYDGVKARIFEALFEQSLHIKLKKMVDGFFNLIEIYLLKDESNQIAQEIKAVGVHVECLKKCINEILTDERSSELFFALYSKVTQRYRRLLGFLALSCKTVASA